MAFNFSTNVHIWRSSEALSWCHDAMEMLSASLALVREIHWSLTNYSHNRPMMKMHLMSRLFAKPFVLAQIKENIKAPHLWTLGGGIHRWLVDSLTKGQWCGKCSHLMTFSWFSLVESLRKLLNKQSNCQWFVTDAMMPIWSHCNVIKGPSPLTHYSDVIMSTMRLKSPASRLFAQPFFWGTQIKENSKAPRHRPLCGESTSDQ